MSEFVKKTALGYKTVASGCSDPECTHVIMTKKEYYKILQDAREIKKELQEKEVIQDPVAAQEKDRQRIIMLETELAQEKEESSYQKRLNKNLLRIAKERANANRKIRPKKQHSGYIVLSSTEKKQNYKDGNGKFRMSVWETVFQSPYSVDFTEEQARRQISLLFQDTVEGSVSILSSLGIDHKSVKEADWHLRANFRSGYWELIIKHSKPINIVPDEKEMRCMDKEQV